MSAATKKPASRKHPPKETKAVTQSTVDQKSRAVRTLVAQRLRQRFSESQFDREAGAKSVGASPFASFASDFPHADPVRLLAFNLAVTEQAVQQLLAEEVSADALVFTVSRAAEMGLNQLLDPDSDTSPIKFLGASKQLGYFFTPPEIAAEMARYLLDGDSQVRRVLDPGAGLGALLGATAIEASRRGVTIEELVAIELDPFTAKLLRATLDRTREILKASWKARVVSGDTIAILSSPEGSLDFEADRVIMNPPYGRVKFLKSSLTNSETRLSGSRTSHELQATLRRSEQLERASELRKLSAELGLDSGPQDLQRVFLGLSLQTLSTNGRLVVISPSSWLGDRDSRLLRKKLVKERRISRIVVFPEGAKLFATVNQPTAIAVMGTAGSGGDEFSIVTSERDSEPGEDHAIRVADIERLDPEHLRIPRLSKALLRALDALLQLPRLRDLAVVKNLRGELDQTADAALFTKTASPLRLIRGDHVERYTIRPPEYSELPSYVDPAKLASHPRRSPKYEDSKQPRIVGRQCSYMKKERRLSFALNRSAAFAGNSCNYISLREPTPDHQILEALTVYLNSAVIEWFFRVFSANNHVANYEIDDLPVRLENPLVVEALARCHGFLESNYSPLIDGGKSPTAIEDYADAVVCFSLGLTARQAAPILNDVDEARAGRILGALEWLHENGLRVDLLRGNGAQLHEPPTLSGLDREIISHVPQGGNWQDIPDTVPSQRLAQIREMTRERGVVRTTYYGRLRPDQPAYTIATYYNRPGNGTNIHPWEARTLTSREAARLQSFPDWYMFAGKDGAIRTQIGNAVPPLLGAAVGAALRRGTDLTTAVDLFAGAGGLSLGLEMASWNVVATADFDRDAVATYRLNHPCETDGQYGSDRTLCLQADLSDAAEKSETIDRIRKKLGGRRLGLLAGGPPCQGFSHAGWRSADDVRNDLAIGYMEFVDALQPELVLIENVEGLLTFGGGRVLRDIVATLAELGYSTFGSPWKLGAEEYGVPQMRRRVFVIGCKTGSPPVAPVASFERCAGRRKKVSADSLFAAASTLPPPICVAEALYGLRPLGQRVTGRYEATQVRTHFAELMAGRATWSGFIERCRQP